MKRLLIIVLVLSVSLVHAADYVIATGENGTEEVYVADRVLHSDWTGDLVVWKPFAAEKLAGTYYDYSSGQHDGTQATAANRPTWQSGNGGHYDFDGNDQFSIADHADFAFSAGFTLMAWVKPDVSDSDRRIIYQYDASSVDGFFLGQASTGSGAWQFLVWVKPSYGFIYSDGIPDTANWQHVAGVREADGTLKMYINGVLQADTDSISGALNSSRKVWIGSNYVGSQDYAGLMDDVRLYGRGLSAAEVEAVYELNDTVYGHSDP